MTPERAREIWQTRTAFGGVSCSAQEDAYVREIWRRMPGATCWAEALLAIANDAVPAERPPLIGTVVFSHGDQIIAQVPVYQGESPSDAIVGFRARRSVELLGMPATDPVHGCNRRLAMLGMSNARFYPRGH